VNPTQTNESLQVPIDQAGTFTSGQLLELQQAIVALVKERDHISFVEIERLCKQRGIEYRGNMRMFLGELSRNVVLWSGLSDVLYHAICTLIEQKILHIWPATPAVYYVDGKILDLPIVQSQRPQKRYTRPTWLPITFRRFPLWK
jgi:hypothetical protein